MTMTSKLQFLPRTLLGAALLAALGSAHAEMALNERGLGQVLLYPYYTVNNGNDTYVTVTNTTNRGKAVKLRFRESRNSRPTLEFSIYLSPYDVWSAALFSLDANGPANLVTADTSCTVPTIRTNTALPQTASGLRYVPFRNFAYAQTHADGGDPGLARSREGHIELIEMGTLRPGAAPTQVLEEVTHNSASGTPNTGVPANCNAVVANWDSINGAWGGTSGNRQLDIDLPTGGLYGTAQIISVANGTLHAYAAEAIEGFYGGTAAPGGLHQAPDVGKPDLADGSDGSATVTARVVLDDGNPVLASFDAGRADAVSALLMQDAIYNEFDTEASIGATSEWIVSFPTKSYYTDRTGPALAPFVEAFPDDGQACERIAPSFWDRETLPTLSPSCLPPGASNPPGSALPPCPPASSFTLCGSASSTAINAAGATGPIFGAVAPFRLSLNASGGIADRGHLRYVFSRSTAPLDSSLPAGSRVLVAKDGRSFSGLPVIGFAATNYVNSNAQPGRLANYSAAVRHRGSVSSSTPPR